MPKEFKHKSEIKCPTCGDVIFSTYSGEFVSCTCRSNEDSTTGCFIDETHWYTRWGGAFLIRDDDGHWKKPDFETPVLEDV